MLVLIPSSSLSWYLHLPSESLPSRLPHPAPPPMGARGARYRSCLLACVEALTRALWGRGGEEGQKNR
eukprot:3650881-Pyramimonas_sp.AAC.1